MNCLLALFILLTIINIVCVMCYLYIRTTTEKYIDED